MRLNLSDILHHVLNESVQPNEVVDAIKNKQQIIITYSDEENHAPQSRLIEPYVYGISKGGNPCIRAFQYQGDTFRGIPKWKLFRLDRITSWRPNGQTFNMTPKKRGWNVEAYNEQGDNSMVQVLNKASFTQPSSAPKKHQKTQDNFGPKKTIQQPQDKRSTYSPEFNDMLKRNLEITRREKARKNKVNTVNKELDSQSDSPQNLGNITVKDNRPRGPITTDSQQQNSYNNKTNDEFQKMLQRNLAITDKEKAKRGFKLSDKKENNNEQ